MVSAEGREGDRMTLAQWLDQNLPSKQAHELLGMALSGTYTSAPSELSMLYVLFQLASAGGPEFVLGVNDAAEDARPVGGMRAIYGAMAAAVSGSVHLEQPVRSIHQDADGVTVRADGMTVRASRGVVAVPLAIASHIIYEPMLPIDRSMLHQRMPIDYTEQDWTVERYSGGGMISHTPPGVLTGFGHALREPCGRIHWAGTESADVMMGFVDGAIRSGERAAREALEGDSRSPVAAPLAMM